MKFYRFPLAAACFFLIPAVYVYSLLIVLESAPQSGAGETVWNMVTDYNVVPADAKSAVDKALADARNYLSTNPAGTLVLYFPAGTYTFHHPYGRGMMINGFKSGQLTLRGAGTGMTKLVFDQFDQIAIYIYDSNNVTVEQMHVTRTGNGGSDPYGFYATQGEVTEVETGRIRFRVHEGFPDPVWIFNAGASADYERTLLVFRGTDLEPELHPKADKIMVGNRITGEGDMIDVGGGFYDAMLANSNTLPNVAVGDRVALKSKCGEQTFRIYEADDCTIQDVRITRAAGNPIRMPYGGNRMTVRRVVIDRPEPINGRASFFSGPGGGIQLYADAGGSLVEDCTVIGTADDGIAIFSNSPTNLTRNTVVRRNTVRDNQARGILITQSDGGVCENNTLIRNHDSSIRLMVEGDDAGIPNAAVRNWVICNNTIIQPWTAATIKLTAGPAGSGLHDNIDISSNLFIQASKNNNIVQIHQAGAVRINGNGILSFSDEDDAAIWGSSDALVQVAGALTVSGKNNTYSGILTRPELEVLDTNAVVGLSWEQSGMSRITASQDASVNSRFPASL